MKCDEIFAALELLEKERGISPTFMMDKIIQALTTLALHQLLALDLLADGQHGLRGLRPGADAQGHAAPPTRRTTRAWRT